MFFDYLSAPKRCSRPSMPSRIYMVVTANRREQERDQSVGQEEANYNARIMGREKLGILCNQVRSRLAFQ